MTAVLVCLLVARELTRHTESALPRDPGRRTLLAVVGGAGMALVAGGGILGRVVRRATRPLVSPRTEEALAAVYEQLGRLASDLETRFEPGEFALIVCADHGQCPTVELTEGVRLDPIQLAEDLNREFGGLFTPVTEVVPSEVYLDETAMWDAGVTRDDVAALLRDYRYGDNIGAYVDHAVVDRDSLDRRPFGDVLSTDFIARLASADLARYGIGRYDSTSDSGIPPRTW